jgi:EAL domain-containing protein (putative c-di-GMP-specific phosphodiesterase class I)
MGGFPRPVNIIFVQCDLSRILTGLKALGVRIAVDDFGSGYSSLAMMQRFPLDTIKIDRSFMRDFAGAKEDTGLADAIVAIGNSLSLTVVAQGVETKEQAELLRLHACDELQGFYFKRPLVVHEFTQLLRDQSPEITYIGKRLRAATSIGSIVAKMQIRFRYTGYNR